MNWFEWIVVGSFLAYVGYVEYIIRKNRRAGGN
jgi:hypothetical protein